MCSSVWSRLSPVFSWKFVCYLYPLQYDSTLKKTFHSKVFFEKWNDTEKPKKNPEKRELAKDKKYNQMGQVGTSWSRGTIGTRRRGSSDLLGTSGTRTRGRSTWTIPLVPNGTTRPWKIRIIRISDFLRIIRIVRIDKNFNSNFSKFWKPQKSYFAFFSDFQNFFVKSERWNGDLRKFTEPGIEPQIGQPKTPNSLRRLNKILKHFYTK